MVHEVAVAAAEYVAAPGAHLAEVIGATIPQGYHLFVGFRDLQALAWSVRQVHV